MEDLFNKRAEYEMAYFDLTQKRFVSNEIAKDKYIEITNLMFRLRIYSDLAILYTSLKNSIKEFECFLNNLPFKGDYEDYSNANRLLLNVTSSFYSLIEFCEKNIDSFKSVLKKQLYDNYFSYRFFYTLRTYLTHESLAITSFYSSITGDAIKTSAIVDLDMLINYNKINKKFKAELKLLGLETISLNDYIEDFNDLADKFIYLIYSDQKDTILELFSNIKSYIPYSRVKIVECFVREKSNKPLSLTKSLSNFCENYSKGIVLSNKIDGKNLDSKDCYYLYKKLAELYFNVPDSIFIFD